MCRNWAFDISDCIIFKMLKIYKNDLLSYILYFVILLFFLQKKKRFKVMLKPTNERRAITIMIE